MEITERSVMVLPVTSHVTKFAVITGTALGVLYKREFLCQTLYGFPTGYVSLKSFHIFYAPDCLESGL